MIDSQLLESARMIRKNFLKLNRDLLNYEDEIRGLVSFLEEKIKILSTDTTNKIKSMKDKSELSNVTKDIVKQIEDIEVEEKKLQKKVSKINSEMERLQKEEILLYDTIKQRYPNLSDNEILQQIQKNLNY